MHLHSPKPQGPSPTALASACDDTLAFVAGPAPVRRPGQGVAAVRRTHVRASTDAKYFEMDAAPLLIPEGEWQETAGSVAAPAGFRAAGVYAGMRAGAKADLALIVCDDGAAAAGTFTQNVMCAAPVTLCKEVLAANGEGVKAVRPLRTLRCVALLQDPELSGRECTLQRAGRARTPSRCESGWIESGRGCR